MAEEPATTVIMRVPSARIGLLLGAKGAQLRFTQGRFGVRAVVGKRPPEGEQAITITGRRAAEAAASMRAILDWTPVIVDVPASRKVYVDGAILLKDLFPDWDRRAPPRGRVGRLGH